MPSDGTIGGLAGKAGAQFLEQPRDVVSALPAARRALDAQHLELTD
jgi:hypothetical protein